MKKKELGELINEYRAAMDAADAAKALILEEFEAQGIKRAVASYEEVNSGTGEVINKVTTVTYRAASSDSFTFDSAAFFKAVGAKEAAAIKAKYSKKRSGAPATVAFHKETA